MPTSQFIVLRDALRGQGREPTEINIGGGRRQQPRRRPLLPLAIGALGFALGRRRGMGGGRTPTQANLLPDQYLDANGQVQTLGPNMYLATAGATTPTPVPTGYYRVPGTNQLAWIEAGYIYDPVTGLPRPDPNYVAPATQYPYQYPYQYGYPQQVPYQDSYDYSAPESSPYDMYSADPVSFDDVELMAALNEAGYQDEFGYSDNLMGLGETMATVDPLLVASRTIGYITGRIRTVFPTLDPAVQAQIVAVARRVAQGAMAAWNSLSPEVQAILQADFRRIVAGWQSLPPSVRATYIMYALTEYQTGRTTSVAEALSGLGEASPTRTGLRQERLAAYRPSHPIYYGGRPAGYAAGVSADWLAAQSPEVRRQVGLQAAQMAADANAIWIALDSATRAQVRAALRSVGREWNELPPDVQLRIAQGAASGLQVGWESALDGLGNEPVPVSIRPIVRQQRYQQYRAANPIYYGGRPAGYSAGASAQYLVAATPEVRRQIGSDAVDLATAANEAWVGLPESTRAQVRQGLRAVGSTWNSISPSRQYAIASGAASGLQTGFEAGFAGLGEDAVKQEVQERVRRRIRALRTTTADVQFLPPLVRQQFEEAGIETPEGEQPLDVLVDETLFEQLYNEPLSEDREEAAYVTTDFEASPHRRSAMTFF